jgi:hypothetical protein
VCDTDTLIESKQRLEGPPVDMQTVAGPVWLPSFISLLLTQDPIHQEEHERERGLQVRKKRVMREWQEPEDNKTGE